MLKSESAPCEDTRPDNTLKDAHSGSRSDISEPDLLEQKEFTEKVNS
jgi:hypothetical protein